MLLVLFNLILLRNRCSASISFFLIDPHSFFLLSLFNHSELLFTHSVLFISLSNLHDLLCFALRLLNLFPSLLLFHFEKSNTIGKELRIICSFFLINSSFLESASHFIWLLIISIVLSLGAVVLFISFFIYVLLAIVGILLLWMFLSLWNWLRLFRRLDFFYLLLIRLHLSIVFDYKRRNRF